MQASLDNFSQTMRDYQQRVIDDACAFLDETQEDLDTFPRRLYACPTGTGKGSMQLALLKTLRAKGVDAWILSPALEVLRGCLQRCGVEQSVIDAASADKLADMGAAIFVSTPLRVHNRALQGDMELPEVVIYDEAHHATEGNEVSGTLFALAPDAVWIGMTATPYRGTPRGTVALREAWGEPQVVLTIPEAIHKGYMACPTFSVVPLVDDDTITVTNGKFAVRSSGNRVRQVSEDLALLVASKVYQHVPGYAEGLVDIGVDGLIDYENTNYYLHGGKDVIVKHDMPTILVVPNTSTAAHMVLALDAVGVMAHQVIGKTKIKARGPIYAECAAGRAVIVCVAVLSEGVDFPWLGRLIDARPTVSPVEFVQRLGRVMRPKDFTPEYICTNRNMERFAYLLGGAVPPDVVAEAQSAFPVISKRDGVRSVGFEALARFKRIPFPIKGGLRGSMFNVHEIDAETGLKTDWCILTTPLSEKPIVAKLETQTLIDPKTGERTYPTTRQRYQRAEMPTDLAGFATSQQTRGLSDKQIQWWERAAHRVGLDGTKAEEITRRQFQALPVLSDLKVNIRSHA